jgi:hypothetical protein
MHAFRLTYQWQLTKNTGPIPIRAKTKTRRKDPDTTSFNPVHLHTTCNVVSCRSYLLYLRAQKTLPSETALLPGHCVRLTPCGSAWLPTLLLYERWSLTVLLRLWYV